MRAALLCLTLPLFTASCVYFNTFYNAESFFRQARSAQLERLRTAPDSAPRVIQSEEDLYAKSIEKCSKVMNVYPSKKKYLPLATFLIGEVYYCKGDYPNGIRKFNEFAAHYPQHKKLFEALFYKGLCYLELGDLDPAEVEFQKVAEGASPALKTKAQYLLAEISVRRGSSFDALDRLKNLKGGGKMIKSLINYKMGNLLFSQKDYAGAHAYFIKVEAVGYSRDLAEVNVPENLKFKSELMAGRCLVEMGKGKEAVRHFESLLDNDRYFKFFGEILNLLAASHTRDGRPEAAKAIYLRVIDEYKKSHESAVACYELGLLFEKSFGDLEEAFKYFSLAVLEFPGCDEAKWAAERQQALRSIRFFMSNPDSILSADTTLNGQDSARLDSLKSVSKVKRLFAAADLFLFSLGNGDSAIFRYREILGIDSTADSLLPARKAKMKALYAIAWIRKNLSGRAEEADSLFREVLSQYPATEYAKAAQRALGGPVTVETREDSLNHQFLAAESLYFQSGDFKAALTAFDAFAKSYPAEMLAAKAMLNGAWLCENRLGDNKQAESRYRILLEKYSESEYGRFARRKLQGKEEGFEEITIDRPGEGPEGTVLNVEMAKRIEREFPSPLVESSDEAPWVTLSSLEAAEGKLEDGGRTREALTPAAEGAMETIDQIYIDLVEEGLAQEGDLEVRLWVNAKGEVTKVRSERGKGPLTDKTLLEEVENTLSGTAFPPGKAREQVLLVHLNFKNRGIFSGGDE